MRKVSITKTTLRRTHSLTHSLTVFIATDVSPARVNVKLASPHGHDEKSVLLSWTQESWPITLPIISAPTTPTSVLFLDIVIAIHSRPYVLVYARSCSLRKRKKGLVLYYCLVWAVDNVLCVTCVAGAEFHAHIFAYRYVVVSLVMLWCTHGYSTGCSVMGVVMVVNALQTHSHRWR